MTRNGIVFALILGLWPLPSPAADQIGVVLMHGKQSAPNEHLSLATAMVDAGFPTELPEMCWSARRIYDRPYGGCLSEIAASMGRAIPCSGARVRFSPRPPRIRSTAM